MPSSLATIMFTDLVDSTGQRSRIGDDAADAVVARHDQIVTEAAAANAGQVVKTLGDGALIVFSSAIDAVLAGLSILEEAAAVPASPADGELAVRVGVHAGEVVMTDGDLSGLPVAIASRVCGAAAGSQMLVTSVVRSLIGRRGDLGMRSIGLHALKGLPEPMELWEVAAGVDGEPAEPATKPIAAIATPGFLNRARPPVLVGRQSEYALINAAYSEVRHGAALMAALSGEPGMGKTALTSTWATDAAEEGATVVGGRCTQDVAVPYEPFIEMARAVLSVRPDRFGTLGAAAGNVAMLVPGVATAGKVPAPAQSDPDTMRYLMAEAFSALLAPDGAAPATVAVIDDLHWADESSLEVLTHLLRAEARYPLLVVGTYRDTDLVRSHPLPRLLADLRREGRVHRILLDPLGKDEVHELVAAHIGRGVASDVTGSIMVETRGNPFFVTEMTAHLRDEGLIDEQGRWAADSPIGDYGIPEGVRDLVGRRLERLGDTGMALLTAGAVIGPAFSLDIAGSVAQLDADEVDDAADAALNAGVLVEGDTPDTVSFGHALVRQTVYDDLPPRRRLRLHRAVAAALEDAGVPAAEVLRHWVTADVADRALPLAIRAAVEARRATSERDAMRHFELALDLWPDVEDPEDLAGMTHTRLVLELSAVFSDFAVDPGRAMEMIDAELSSGVDDPAERAMLYLRKSDHLWQSGDLAGSEDAVETSIVTIPRDEPTPDLAMVLANQAGRLMTAGLHQKAIDAGLEAAVVVEQVDAPSAAIRLANALGTSYGVLGDLERSEKWFDRLRELAEATGNVRARLLGYMNLGEVLIVNGLFDRALELSIAGTEVSRSLGAQRWEAAITGNLASVLYIVGRWDEAMTYLDAMPPESELDFPELMIIRGRLTIFAERGDGRAFKDCLDRIAGYDLTNQEPQVNGLIWHAMMSRHRWNRELDQAYEVAATAARVWGDVRDWINTGPVAAGAVGVIADAVERGESREGWVESARWWNEKLQSATAPVSTIGVWKAVASAELARVDGDDQPDLWRQALAAASEHPYVAALVRWRLARSLAGIDPDDPEIPGLLEAAAVTAQRLKAEPLLEAVMSEPGAPGESPES